MTFGVASSIISATPSAPLSDVTPSEPIHKRPREVSTSLVEWLEMLAEFEKVWSARKRSLNIC